MKYTALSPRTLHRLAKLAPVLLASAAFILLTATAYAQVAGAGYATMGKAIGAGLAIGLSGVGAGYAVGAAGAAMISAITEKPEMFGRAIVVVALGEGIAIYGLLIAILVMSM